MPGLMRACDVLVQNAGGLTSLEAFACGLPVASYRCIPGHGLTNAAALDAAGLALWITEPTGLGPALTALAGSGAGERQRAAGLALGPHGAGPAELIAAAAAGIPGPAELMAAAVTDTPGPAAGRIPAARAAAASGAAAPAPVRGARRAPAAPPRAVGRRTRVAAAALAITVGAGIGAPLLHSYEAAPSRFGAVAHHLWERYEL
jgi:hypothetical protein